MLYTRQKEITIAGRAIRLYSLDGGELFIKPRDVKEFRRRPKAALRAGDPFLLSHDPFDVPTVIDFWL